jgi:hypothetical protein
MIENNMERILHVFTREETNGIVKYPVCSDVDQIDGQAHVLMAWAKLALARNKITQFEDKTYNIVAKLVDRTTDWPYFHKNPYSDQAKQWPTVVNLIRNCNLEHSREGRYWDAWDLLTQSFVGSALNEMIKIADRRKDNAHAALWRAKLETLKSGISRNLTRQVDGKQVYLEMRLPNSSSGVPFLGMSWINFSPIAAQWDPLDRQVLRNTVDLIRKVSLQTTSDNRYKWLPTEWNTDGTFANQVIGKGVGWEIEYCRQEKEHDRIIEWLDFVESVNSTRLYMEAANLVNGKWVLQDSGNAEQTTWWCWSMANLRKEFNLSVKPDK